MSEIKELIKSLSETAKKEEATTTGQPEEPEGPVEWKESDKQPWKYKATIGKVTVYAKDKTSGNQVFHFIVQGDKTASFKIMHDGVYDIVPVKEGDKITSLGYALSTSGPFYSYTLEREDDNVFLKEKILISYIPTKLPALIHSYKVQTKNVKLYETKKREIIFHDETTNEILFYAQTPKLYMPTGEDTEAILELRKREEGINIFLDLYLLQCPPLETTEENPIYIIDPTFGTTTEGRTGEYVQYPNTFLQIGLFIGIIALGFLLLMKFTTGIEKAKAQKKSEGLQKAPLIPAPIQTALPLQPTSK